MLCYFSHVEDDQTDIVMDAINDVVTTQTEDQIIGMAILEMNTLLLKLGTMWNDEDVPFDEFHWALAKVIFHTSTLAFKFTKPEELNAYTEQYAKEMLTTQRLSPKG